MLISCFNSYDLRVKYIEEVLTGKGYDCIYVTSDYDHIKKQPMSIDRPGVIQIPTVHYKNNISLTRFFSHFIFSLKVRWLAKEIKPDLIYAMIPPNSLAASVAAYKKEHGALVIYDIMDLWPETFPVGRIKKVLSFPFGLWESLRNKSLSKANCVITECNLFRDRLDSHLKSVPHVTMYVARTAVKRPEPAETDVDVLHLCYLGSINNIIDIGHICELLSEISKRKCVVLHVIGDGSSRDRFIEETKRACSEVIYYGIVFDDDKKSDILSKCHFGLNIMKESVCVGLTLKSIEYMAFGLPLMNNIPADTHHLVDKYGVGINIERLNVQKAALRACAITSEEMRTMKRHVADVFDQFFSVDSFKDKAAEAVDMAEKSGREHR